MSIINLPGVALVTGASQGIGRATALGFAAAGVKGLVLSARNGARLEQVAEEARQLATNPDFETLVILCDICNEEEIVNLITKSVEKFDVIDYAVNNAGVRNIQANPASESAWVLTKKSSTKFIAQKAIPFATITTEEMDQLANTNARGSFLCTREQIKAMLTQPRKDIKGLTSTTTEAERGCIVNVSSLTALGAMPYSGSYVPTTWSRLGMTKSAAVDHGADGIRINSLLAGYTVTDGFMAHPNASKEFEAAITQANPLKRLATSEDVADAIIFLCSPLARFVSGHGLSVDGGHSVTFA